MYILVGYNTGVLIDYATTIDSTNSLYHRIIRESEIINYPKSSTKVFGGVDISYTDNGEVKDRQIQKWKYISNVWSINTDYVDPNEITSANKLTTAREIKLTGNVTGEKLFDGSGNIEIETTISINVSSTKPVTDLNTPNGVLWIKT